MSTQSRNKMLGLLFLALVLAIPFAMIYYVSTDTYQSRVEQWRQGNRQAAVTAPRPAAPNDPIRLLRDERREIGRIALVFKDYAKKTIFLDVYILDLDPEQPYPVEIGRKDAKEQMRLGDNYYRLVSVSDRYLTIEPLETFQTP